MGRLSEIGYSAIEWLDDVESGLNELDAPGPVARLRRSWALQSVGDLKKEINEPDGESD